MINTVILIVIMIIKFIKSHEIRSPNYKTLSHNYVKIVTYQGIIIRYKVINGIKSQNYNTLRLVIILI